MIKIRIMRQIDKCHSHQSRRERCRNNVKCIIYTPDILRAMIFGGFGSISISLCSSCTNVSLGSMVGHQEASGRGSLKWRLMKAQQTTGEDHRNTTTGQRSGRWSGRNWGRHRDSTGHGTRERGSESGQLNRRTAKTHRQGATDTAW